MSEAQIIEQIVNLYQYLGLFVKKDITQLETIDLLQQACAAIIEREGGASKSERAKKANALDLLLKGYQDNRDRIDANKNNTFSMEEFNFSNLAEAASYARRGSNSAVLTKVEYYCHHPLLEDGNVLVDMPGIDAPVKKDAELTYSKIEHADTSAVICVLKAAAAGEMTASETELMEKMKSNLGIRDRFGLDSIFIDSVKGVGGKEETPQFVNEFNNYCTSGKLTKTNFRISVNSYETPNENYTRILSEFGTPLIEQLILDSGIKEFRQAITRYLTEEKRPQLFVNLAEDLKPICLKLKQHYLKRLQELDNQPHEIESMKTQ